MEPLLPGYSDSTTFAPALVLIRGAERLRASLHPITRKLVTDLVRSMNSYYSNLMEGRRGSFKYNAGACCRIISGLPDRLGFHQLKVKRKSPGEFPGPIYRSTFAR